MRPITKQEYEELNQCLNKLHHVFKRLGVAEFSISKGNRTLVWDHSEKLIDIDLLNKFCTNITDFCKKELKED